MNREAERFWGKPQEELLGRDIREIFSQAVGTEGYRAIDRAAKVGVATEFEAACSGVPGAWVGGQAYPSAEGLSVYFRDVTERKRAEEALRESEGLVRQLLRNFPTGSVNVFDRDLRYLPAEGGGSRMRDSDPGAASDKIALAKESTIEAMNLTRDLAQALRGAEVRGSLSGTLSSLVEAAVPPGVERAVCVEGDEALVPPRVREELFAILREGVRNAVSHSEAGRIDVGVRVCAGEVVGYVEDDGRGFFAGEEGATRGGVRSIRERTEIVEGTFELSSASGVGTSIGVTIPLKGGPDNGT